MLGGRTPYGRGGEGLRAELSLPEAAQALPVQSGRTPAVQQLGEGDHAGQRQRGEGREGTGGLDLPLVPVSLTSPFLLFIFFSLLQQDDSRLAEIFILLLLYKCNDLLVLTGLRY